MAMPRRLLMRAEKHCPDCDTTKAASEFGRNRARYDGFSSICRLCTGERQRTRRGADIEAARAYNRRKTQEWRAAHPDAVEQGRTDARRWRRDHVERARASVKRWHALNPEYGLLFDAKRRAQKLGAGLETITAAQWRALLEYFNFRCAYCLAPMTALAQDHIHALSRGGQHVLGNIVPACKSCNSRKGASTLIEFLARSVATEDTK